MRAPDGTGLVKRVAGGRPGGARRGPLAAALPALLMLCCLFGLTATASAASPAFSGQALLARLALQQAMLTAADGATGDTFGCSVAISGDTALVGAELPGTLGRANTGAAYVFTRSAGSWTQQAKLIAADGATGDGFGLSVALSGETALIGAPGHAVEGKANAGAAYVFTRSGGVWTQEAELSSDGDAGDTFGVAVAVLGDTALVGAPRCDVAGQADAGAAYVFTRSGVAWAQQAELRAAAGAALDGFGRSVALSGETALIGAPGHTTAGQVAAGAAYVFARSGAVWAQQAALTAASGATDDWFGHSVALFGEAALIGAPYHDVAGHASGGAAYIFLCSGGVWAQQAELTAANGATGDFFGSSVALGGGTALVGAEECDVAGQEVAGAAYAFVPSGGVWTQQAELTAGDDEGTAGDWFGSSVAVSGETALVGAIWADTPGKPRSGAAYVFLLDAEPQPTPAIVKLKPASGKRGDTVTISGTGFGVARGHGFVKFGATKCITYLSWSDTRIKCKAPAAAKFGKVNVTVTTVGGASNAMSFTVKR